MENIYVGNIHSAHRCAGTVLFPCNGQGGEYFDLYHHDDTPLRGRACLCSESYIADLYGGRLYKIYLFGVRQQLYGRCDTGARTQLYGIYDDGFLHERRIYEIYLLPLRRQLYGQPDGSCGA